MRVSHADRGADGFVESSQTDRQPDDWDAAVQRLSKGQTRNGERNGKVNGMNADTVNGVNADTVNGVNADTVNGVNVCATGKTHEGSVKTVNIGAGDACKRSGMDDAWDDDELAVEESLMACNIGSGCCK
jgi:hypothetical protein